MIDHKTRDAYIDAYLDGASIAPVDMRLRALVGMNYDLRKKLKQRDEQIETMDDVARNNGWKVKCRSCERDWEPDIELSEFTEDGNYCGGSERCVP